MGPKLFLKKCFFCVWMKQIYGRTFISLRRKTKPTHTQHTAYISFRLLFFPLSAHIYEDFFGCSKKSAEICTEESKKKKEIIPLDFASVAGANWNTYPIGNFFGKSRMSHESSVEKWFLCSLLLLFVLLFFHIGHLHFVESVINAVYIFLYIKIKKKKM